MWSILGKIWFSLFSSKIWKEPTTFWHISGCRICSIWIIHIYLLLLVISFWDGCWYIIVGCGILKSWRVIILGRTWTCIVWTCNLVSVIAHKAYVYFIKDLLLLTRNTLLLLIYNISVFIIVVNWWVVMLLINIYWIRLRFSENGGGNGTFWDLYIFIL